MFNGYSWLCDQKIPLPVLRRTICGARTEPASEMQDHCLKSDAISPVLSRALIFKKRKSPL